jgi:methionyl-tRNA synthetase
MKTAEQWAEELSLKYGECANRGQDFLTKYVDDAVQQAQAEARQQGWNEAIEAAEAAAAREWPYPKAISAAIEALKMPTQEKAEA